MPNFLKMVPISKNCMKIESLKQTQYFFKFDSGNESKFLGLSNEPSFIFLTYVMLELDMFAKAIRSRSIGVFELGGDAPQEIFNAPEDKLFNDGWVANATEWNWEDMALPKTDSGTIVKILADFDTFQGVVGLDNVRVYTKQK